MMNNPVSHPSHYTVGEIEVIEFIEDWDFPYHLGNAIKYICRAGRKDPSKTEEDLNKACWYITRFLTILHDQYSREWAAHPRWHKYTASDFCRDQCLPDQRAEALKAICFARAMLEQKTSNPEYKIVDELINAVTVLKKEMERCAECEAENLRRRIWYEGI